MRCHMCSATPILEFSCEHVQVVYLDSMYNQRSLCHTYKLLHVGSSIARLWSYSLPKVVSEYINDWTNLCNSGLGHLSLL